MLAFKIKRQAKKKKKKKNVEKPVILWNYFGRRKPRIYVLHVNSMYAKLEDDNLKL